MKFAFALLPIAAALRFVGAVPVSAEDLTKRAPVPVTSIFCNGLTYKCTALLDFDDGNWIAQWSSSMVYEGQFGSLTAKPKPIENILVKSLSCDGNAHMCTAKLDWGDGHWAAQWGAEVFSQALFISQEDSKEVVALGSVPVKRLTCDGDPTWQRCTAYLVWGGGDWVAQWGINIYHQSLRFF